MAIIDENPDAPPLTPEMRAALDQIIRQEVEAGRMTIGRSGSMMTTRELATALRLRQPARAAALARMAGLSPVKVGNVHLWPADSVARIPRRPAGRPTKPVAASALAEGSEAVPDASDAAGASPEADQGMAGHLAGSVSQSSELSS